MTVKVRPWSGISRDDDPTSCASYGEGHWWRREEFALGAGPERVTYCNKCGVIRCSSFLPHWRWRPGDEEDMERGRCMMGVHHGVDHVYPSGKREKVGA